MIPKNISEFVTSDDSNTVYLETTAGTITKATFCITEEMQKRFSEGKPSGQIDYLVFCYKNILRDVEGAVPYTVEYYTFN